MTKGRKYYCETYEIAAATYGGFAMTGEKLVIARSAAMKQSHDWDMGSGLVFCVSALNK
jgi:hypothetical protein